MSNEDPAQQPAPDQPAPDQSAPDQPTSEENQTQDAKPATATREPGTPLTEDYCREALKEVIDPELFVNIVDLGLIYTVNVKNREDGKYDVDIEMTMTSPMCPAGPQLVANSRGAIAKIEDVEEVDVKVVMDPPWTQDMMTDDAKDQLNIF